MDAQFVLSDTLSLGVSASGAFGQASELGLDTSLRYSDDQGLNASLGAELHRAGDASSGTVTASAQYAQDGPFTATFNARQSLFGAAGTLLALSGSYRDGQFGVLGRLDYRRGTELLLPGGSPAGDVPLSRFTAELGANLLRDRSEYRAGVLLSTDPYQQGLLTDASLGGRYWITDRFGLGGYGHLYALSGQTQFGVSAEATFVPYRGVSLTAGYTFGALSWTGAQTAQKFYLRLDLLEGTGR